MELAEQNSNKFNEFEHSLIQSGYFDTSNFFGRSVDVWTGTPSISREIENSIRKSVDEKMEKIIEEELSNE